jgi:DNA-binding CsgD family transcriptional regulator/PAS domain-containing protein
LNEDNQVHALNYTDTVGSFYEAAANPDLWSDALQTLSTASGCRGALLTTPVFVPGGLVHTTGLSEAAGQFFEEGWYRNDVRNAAVKPHHWHSGFFNDHSLFSDLEMARSDYYQNFARKADVPWFAAGRLMGELSNDAVSISLQRSSKQGAFTAGEMAALNDLLPRLGPSMILASRLAAMKGQAMVEGLQLARQPAILLRPNGTVVFVNPAAEALLGKRLLLRRQKLSSSQPDEDRQLQALITQACRAAGGLISDDALLRPVMLPASEAGGRLVVTAAPIRRSGSDVVGFSGAILLITDFEAQLNLPPDVLQHTFGLTKREAQVMALLGDGHTVQQIGARLAIGTETVRHHVKTIFTKTGTSRQAEVTALCLRMYPVVR